MPRGRTSPAISSVSAREVIDSRGNPTVEAEVATSSGIGRASVPSGASTGRHEAVELRDGDPKRYHGKGVRKAVSNVVKIIGPALRGFDCRDQRRVDMKMVELDGTTNKAKLGANAILAVSMATARAAAAYDGVHLFEVLGRSKRPTMPVPMMNVINGGLHAGNALAVQEFLIEPTGAPTCTEAIRAGSEVYHSLKEYLTEKHGRGAINVGDEGGFAPPLRSTPQALKAIRESVKRAGYGEGEVRLGIDAASSSFYQPKTGKYSLDGRDLTWEKLEDAYASLVDEYGLLTIEDPFAEDSFDSFVSITQRLGRRTTVIGDDIYVTNVSRMRKGIKMNATNGVLVKLNQIGTVSETEDALKLAKEAGWEVAVSHRSGETEDPFIAHLAAAFEARFIKAGAPSRGERTAKYNELVRIEEAAGGRARFAGAGFG